MSVQPYSLPSLSELTDMLVTIFPSKPLTSMLEGQTLQVVMSAATWWPPNWWIAGWLS
ncbi:MAG TPA: hypothetical protein VIQ81_03690 [Gammaproteobacteria bacterium]